MNEKLIDDLEKVPFYGPYLAWWLAVHVGLSDAMNLTNLRNALYEETSSNSIAEHTVEPQLPKAA